MRLNAVLGLDSSHFMQGIAGANTGVAGLIGSLRGIAGPISAAMAGFTSLAAAFRVGVASLKAAATMEDFETSFVTLLGSADAAKERLDDLSKFAASTPFELPEVARASRTLETLTRGMLSTGQGLTLVGDVAAATQQPFGDLAVVIGRLYDGLQSGRPVGEAMMRLQELGIISGDVRGKIESLQAEGARGENVWRIAAESFGRFAGEMDRKSQTMNGRLSTLSDAWEGLAREIGGPVMEVAKGEVSKLTGLLEDMGRAIKDAKTYWADVFRISRGGGAGGLETVRALLEEAKALEGLADKQALVANAERELASLQERARKVPELDFSQSLAQVQGLLTYVRQLPDGILAVADAQEQAAAKLEAIEGKRPELDRSINAAVRAMQDELDRSVLRSPNASREDKEVSATLIAQRATDGVLTSPPQNLEEAKKRLELEMQLVEEMRRHPEMLDLAAQKAEGIVSAYREVLGLVSQINSERGSEMEREVTAALNEIFGSMGGGLAAEFNALGAFMSDRLTRIGGFVGGEGGPAADYARRSAVANERTFGEMQRLNRNFERGQNSEPRAKWA